MRTSNGTTDRNQWLRRALAWMAFFGLALALGSVRAQGTDWPNEYAKRVRSTENVSPLGDEAFGDKVSLFNGTVRFSHDLIAVPGNSGLRVALGIFHDPHDIAQGQLNGNWDLDIPYVGAVHESKSSQQNGWVPVPANVNNGYVEFDRSMFWSGNRLTIDGGGGGDLLSIPADPKRVKPVNSINYTYATKDGWFFSELPSVQNGPGKGLIGYAPDGTKYTFDWLVYRRYSSITHPWGYNVPNALLHRYKLKLYVSKIEDRFGLSTAVPQAPIRTECAPAMPRAAAPRPAMPTFTSSARRRPRRGSAFRPAATTAPSGPAGTASTRQRPTSSKRALAVVPGP